MKHLYLLAFSLLLSGPIFSKHIIGGALTYECLGGGNYRFTLRMYRDCSDPSGAYFDGSAPFSIYKENANGTYTLLETIYRNVESPEDIDPSDSNPCVEVPPNVCVQEGIYSFEYHFADWPSTSSYHITYQRCCRNATVSNIETPGQVGATFTVELTAAAQAVCNNSPVYSSFPPILLCVNEPFVYDHSAFDAEGDQLVYEFCSPLLGGGQSGLGGGNADACNGITPDPACPPPYEEANFVNPPYSPFNPMGGNPQLSINSQTGLLTGTPNTLGQFSVAICVKEYRNGQLLSTIRRDFQFNVLICDALVKADFVTPGLTIIGDDYFVKSCNKLDLPFQNQSVSNIGMDSLQWEFFINSDTFIYDDENLVVNFPSPGVYEGRLVLNPGFQCNDTAHITVEIYPEVVADFGYDYDTCVAGPVTFLNRSAILGAGQIARWEWELEPGLKDSVQFNPTYVYVEPGTKPVSLQVWDEHGCKDDTTRSVTYQPVPAIIFVKPNDTISCAPALVFFNNKSSPLDETYQVNWSFGDGERGTEISPTHSYLNTGTYDVRLEITSPIGCYTDTTFEDLVQILAPPIADFSYDPTNPSNLAPLVTFMEESQNAVHWDWYVDGKLVAQQPDFSFNFLDTGLHEVKLVVVHPQKCLDTLVQFIDVTPEVTYYLPNAFTPNEDTVNDFFVGTGVTRGITNFNLSIWDRYGQKIFETNKVDEPWNGRLGNEGRQAQNGLYLCIVSYTGPRGEPFSYRGYATLLR
ncbi:MAG: PKD domain-containing protein [Saprospiraceae bacterium]|nr:PKD domain-containing protein [Saprospiraceae bacterium]